MKKLKKWERVSLKLKKREVLQLKQITGSGIQPVKRYRRAQQLLLMNAGKSAREAAEATGVAEATTIRIRRRYVEWGLEGALSDRPRPGKKRLLSGKESQRIVAMVCGPAPEGYAVWSIKLIVEEAIKRKIVKRVGRETIRLLFLSHDLKPWREKNVVHRGSDG